MESDTVASEEPAKSENLENLQEHGDEMEENNGDAEKNKADDEPEGVDPYQYTKRPEFTSEIFKVEISNLPRFGFKQLKKRLNGMGVNPVKVKAVGRDKFAFATFRNEEEREDAIQKINGHVWKCGPLAAKKASATADPLWKKRRAEEAGDGGEEKKPKLVDDGLTPEERLKNAVTPFWKIPYEEQLQTKYEELEKTLQVLGNLIDKNNVDFKPWLKEQRDKYNRKCCELLPVKPSPVTEGYRNKCEFTIGKDINGQDNTVGMRYGLYKDGTSTVGEPDCLAIMPDNMKAAVKHFQTFIRSSNLTSYNPETHEGHWRLLTVRTCQGGDMLLTVDFHPQNMTKEAIDEEKSRLKSYFTEGDGKDCKVTCLFWRTYSGVQTGTTEAAYEHIYGNEHLEEKLFDLKFRVSPDAFFQVNTLGAEILYSQVAEWCNVSPETTVLDICCGTGTIGISMANKVDQVIGVELCEQAVEDAKKNARMNGIYNCRYYCGRAEDLMANIMKSLNTKDVVAVLDPPRAGIHPKVINAIRMCPVLTKLVYVSCNPRAALNNFVDLTRRTSKKKKGDPYKPVKAIPVDLFPHTKHCEMVILFERELPTKSATNQTVDSDDSS